MARRGSSYKGTRKVDQVGRLLVGGAPPAVLMDKPERKKLSNAEFRRLRNALADTDDRLWQLQRQEREID